LFEVDTTLIFGDVEEEAIKEEQPSASIVARDHQQNRRLERILTKKLGVPGFFRGLLL
jgi:hypothetical protein